MASTQADRQPLLSSVHSQQHRLSQGRISFPLSSSSAFATDQPDAEQGSRAGRAPSGVGRVQRKEGLPKLSRECLWSEIKCYGSYILPVLLVFGVLVVGASLLAVGIKQGWFR